MVSKSNNQSYNRIFCTALGYSKVIAILQIRKMLPIGEVALGKGLLQTELSLLCFLRRLFFVFVQCKEKKLIQKKEITAVKKKQVLRPINLLMHFKVFRELEQKEYSIHPGSTKHWLKYGELGKKRTCTYVTAECCLPQCS